MIIRNSIFSDDFKKVLATLKSVRAIIMLDLPSRVQEFVLEFCI